MVSSLFRQPRMINAGLMDRRITIENPGESRGTSGSSKETWVVLVAGLPAQVIPVRGKEKFVEGAMREVYTVQNRFIIRYRENVTKRSRILYNSQIWDVVAINEIGRREGLEVIAQEAK